MNAQAWAVSITAAGVAIPDAGELVRRHLGLTEPPEYWSAPLYDRSPDPEARIGNADLLAATALGVRITSAALADFGAARASLNAVLDRLPPALSLEAADDAVLTWLGDALTGTALDANVAAKLLHRVRPRLVPPLDRTIVDWYARGTGNRSAGKLPNLLFAIRADLQAQENQASLMKLQQVIATENDGALVRTRLRLFDIALWMAAHRSR
jgi:hypothetical protein